jgi:protein-tyrosine phosphatase
MIDIHYHLLFGTDDGPATMEESLQLAEASIQEGVTHIACTPHANSRYPFDQVRNQERLEMLREKLSGRVELGTGCDFHLSDENIEDFAKRPTRYTINGRQYLLVEFSDFGIPHFVDKVLGHMVASGFVPIVTHPERNAAIVSDLSRLAQWTQAGCLVQITAGSLTGQFGRTAEAVAFKLLKQNSVHVIASDAHSVGKRPPVLKKAFEIVKSRFGVRTAQQLCRRNPGAIFRGEPLPQSSLAAEIHKNAGRVKVSRMSWLFGH